MRGDRLLVRRARREGRALVLDGPQEADVGAGAAGPRRRMPSGGGPIAGGGELFQRLLADQASLDMILDGLTLPVVEMLVEQKLELAEGHARDPSSILLAAAVACLTRVETPGDGIPGPELHAGGASSRGSWRRTPPRPSCPAARRSRHREALDRGQAVGFPGVGRDASSDPPPCLLE